VAQGGDTCWKRLTELSPASSKLTSLSRSLVDGEPTRTAALWRSQAALLLRAAGALVAGGLLATALGAISPFRAQVRFRRMRE